jgi:EAL domain-containing protein (putative c-di-GMP-specific phosphodiesterase class I)
MIRLALQGIHNKNHAPQAFEVLARMDCPVRGIVGPLFFHTLTTAGWTEIDIKVMTAVLNSKHIVNSSRPLFINISPETLLNPSAFRKVCSLLEKITDVFNSKIIIEIPERSALVGLELEAVLDELRSVGCLVAIDDYGSCYAGFDRLIAHKWDYCKVCLSSMDSQSDLDWLIKLKTYCESEGVKLIFEKLENLKDLDIFRIFPDLLIQGYAFSVPKLINIYEPVIAEIQYA